MRGPATVVGCVLADSGAALVERNQDRSDGPVPTPGASRVDGLAVQGTMTTDLRDALLRQLDVAWALAGYHLESLTTADCLRRPGAAGLHVQLIEGQWRADWPDHEGYDLGPASIAWTTWHMIFWWSAAIEASFGDGPVDHARIVWPGTAEAVRQRLGDLHDRWRAHLLTLDDEALRSPERTRFPFVDKPFADVVAWLNIELAKNAAEVGYARFVLAAPSPAP